MSRSSLLLLFGLAACASTTRRADETELASAGDDTVSAPAREADAARVEAPPRRFDFEDGCVAPETLEALRACPRPPRGEGPPATLRRGGAASTDPPALPDPVSFEGLHDSAAALALDALVAQGDHEAEIVELERFLALEPPPLPVFALRARLARARRRAHATRGGARLGRARGERG